jgi:hypothetical protein
VYWLDRNLGATQVATSSTDTAAYGGLFQWGRPTDGHQLHSDASPADNELSLGGTDGGGSLSTTITPGHGIFIEGDTSPFDWVAQASNDGTDENNGSDRFNFWNKLDGGGVCPIGFRVPTELELERELKLVSGEEDPTLDDLFASFLIFPASGRRNYHNGLLSYQGSMTFIWTTTLDTSWSRAVVVSGSSSWWTSDPRATGSSVRCLSEL